MQLAEVNCMKWTHCQVRIRFGNNQGRYAPAQMDDKRNAELLPLQIYHCLLSRFYLSSSMATLCRVFP
jgi:hypothetical protein